MSSFVVAKKVTPALVAGFRPSILFTTYQCVFGGGVMSERVTIEIKVAGKMIAIFEGKVGDTVALRVIPSSRPGAWEIEADWVEIGGASIRSGQT